MKEMPRQILAGVTASAAFLSIFSVAKLVWWLALILAALVYAGVILLVPRKKEDHEIEVDIGVTRADLNAALDKCARAVRELQELSKEPKLKYVMADTLRKLAELTRQIAENYTSDPRDLRHSRGFVDHHLDKLMEIVRTYVTLRRQTLTPEAEERLEDIRKSVLEYVPHFEAIYNACLENDFLQLETATKALEQIMKIEAPVRDTRKGR